MAGVTCSRYAIEMGWTKMEHIVELCLPLVKEYLDKQLESIKGGNPPPPAKVDEIEAKPV